MTNSKKLINLLKRKKLKISFAESCTGGLLSSIITSNAGSSKVFDLGLVTYSNQAKQKILKVPNKIIKKYGAVSVQCCLSMVNNLGKISKSHINISVTGIAGPKGGTRKKPVGLVFIGLKFKRKILINKYLFKNKSRINFQKIAVNKVIKTVLSIVK
ncbi:CinA family protein [Candidatus Pelagibacter communis]|uniref:CinA family protein n=1 Tax=Pelagibacter ubique TaxID=198252 RepID=UPI00094D3540|nr:CinA family protein [Candidatus Pelagibacter ubique]